MSSRNAQSKPQDGEARKPALAPVHALAKPDRKGAVIALAGALPPAQIPPEALASPRHDRLIAIAFAISLALHLTAAAIHFSPFDFSRLANKEPPLEVALVNAKSATKPTKADILAQANLDGGGNTDQKRHAKTPLPVMPHEPAKNVVVPAQSAESKPQQRPEIITQVNANAAVDPQPAPEQAQERTDSPTVSQLMQKTLEAIRLEAQIAFRKIVWQLPELELTGEALRWRSNPVFRGLESLPVNFS